MRVLCLLCIILISMVSTSAVTAAEAPSGRIAFVQDWVIEGAPVTSIAAADFTGDTEIDLAVAWGRDIEIFRWDAQRTPIAKLVGLPAPVTSLTAGDVDADLLPELLAGTANAGSIRVFGWNGSEFVRKGDTRYLWSAVSSLDVADLNDNGWGDIVAITEKGDGFVFAWDGLHYSPIWQGGGSGPLTNLILEDLDGDNVPEILMARRQGSVSVLKWTDDGLRTIWENYPWGAVSYCTAADTDGDGISEILVATSQKMLYVYKWDDASYPLDRYLPELYMTFDGMAHGDLNEDGCEELIVWGEQGLFVHSLSNGRLVNLWEASFLYDIRQVIALNGRLMVLDKSGSVRSFVPVAADYLKLFVQGEETDSGKVIWREGHLLIPIGYIAERYGMDILYSRAKDAAVIFQGLKGVIVSAGEAQINVDGDMVEVETVPVALEGNLYVPLEVLRQLGLAVEFDEATRALSIR